MDNQFVSIFSDLVFQLLSKLWAFIGNIVLFIFTAIVLFVFTFILFYRINPFAITLEQLAAKRIKFPPHDLLRWLLYDIKDSKRTRQIFKPYGFTIFAAPQGGGKTISLVKYLVDLKRKYPKCLIVTNFDCSIADMRMNGWRDFLDIRNDTDGVIFAIDEINSEYTSTKWQDFPETILSQICMLRKQKIKVVATSQVYSRVAKQIREQTFSVVVCRTWFGRLTSNKEYDAAKFATSGDNVYSLRKGVRPISRKWFVQSNQLRDMYDTDEVVQRLAQLDFIPRDKRGNI